MSRQTAIRHATSIGRQAENGCMLPRSALKIFCARSCKGESEPFYEKLALHVMGILQAGKCDGRIIL